MHVFVLEATVSAPDSENTMEWEDSITSVHATRSSAIHRLGEWLRVNGIDPDAAHYGAVTTATSFCNDPDPDTLDGIELHWGINRMEVHQ